MLNRAPGASVSIVARRHDINANLLFKWRRQLDADGLAVPDVGGDLLPIGIVGKGTADRPALLTRLREVGGDEARRGGSMLDRAGLMEIELADGVTVRADATVDERALRRVLSALKRSR